MVPSRLQLSELFTRILVPLAALSPRGGEEASCALIDKRRRLLVETHSRIPHLMNVVLAGLVDLRMPAWGLTTMGERSMPMSGRQVLDVATGGKRVTMTKVVGVVLVATVLVAIGEILLSAGMKQVGKEGHEGWRMVLAAGANPLVWGGVFLSAAFFGMYLLTLSWADISYVMPFTALSYLFVAVMASRWLQEDVTPARWLGTVLIVIGVIVIGFGEGSQH